MILEGWDESGIRVLPIGGPAVRLSVADLLECAPARFDPESGQRLGGMAEDYGEMRLTGVTERHDGWSFTTDTGAALFVRPRDVGAYLAPPPVRPAPEPWLTMAPRRFDYDDYRGDDDCRRRCLLHVARHGWALLTGVPAREGEVEAVVRSFGFVRETNYGRVFDVRSKASVTNLADTARALEPHTDNPYRDPAPGLQLLHCLAASAEGGATRLVDGLAITETLRAEHPLVFAMLALIPVRFGWGDGANSLQVVKPVIDVAQDGTFAAIRYNNRAFRWVEGSAENRADWRPAIATLAALINAPEHGISLKLAPGDCLIMDNARILHGRTAFANGTKVARHLQGAYADRDGLLSTLAVLTDQEIGRRMEQLSALFALEAMGCNYGEDLSVRAHQLQAAELAWRQGHDASIVAACLLHDIGWALPNDDRGHDHSGADYLADLFPPAVSESVRLHVMAKRYLVTAEPDYRACLSQASVDTLARQGGPMTEDEARAFVDAPGFEAAVVVRRLDDAAKIPGRAVPDFSAYTPMLKRLIAQHLGS